VGILGGSAGTTYDAFKLVAEAQKYGARAALFGRKINNAECQLAFIEFLRRIVNGEITPEEAVKAYHGVLRHLKIRPQRSLDDDMRLQSGVMSYGGSSVSVHKGVPAATSPEAGAAHGACGCKSGKPDACGCKDKPGAASPESSGQALPDFAKMSRADKLAYNKAKRDRIFG
jgi:hypothetical protein